MPDGSRLKETEADRRVAELVYRASRDELAGYVAELEGLAEDRAAIAERTREVFATARGRGYDVRAIRALIRRRKDAVLALYVEVMGAGDA